MLYAKVVFGLPIEGPFDYIVPPEWAKKIKKGSRVRVNFRFKEETGYVTALSAHSSIKKIKTIAALIDDIPLLDRNMLVLTRKLADYYCCSWGEAIETALPLVLRSGRKLECPKTKESAGRASVGGNPSGDRKKNAIILLQETQEKKRWDFYLDAARRAIQDNRSVIILLPSIDAVLGAKDMIAAHLGQAPALLYRKESGQLEEWLKARYHKTQVAVGTRSAIFAPFNNLGLIVIDQESDPVYKQDQVPHYHAREVALMRAKIEQAELVLGSASPSLEALSLSGRSLIFNPARFPEEIKLVDMGQAQYDRYQKGALSKYLIDRILAALENKEKILLFLNRLGFATFASCGSCGWVLKCPRCNQSLVYHFKQGVLTCHHCNFKTPKQELCPQCNSGYIRYQGLGTEKIESELSRLFPQAKIKRLDDLDKAAAPDADILISSRSMLKRAGEDFDFVAALSIDNLLNHIDFRAAEKAFGLLLSISALAKKKLLIQTGLFNHHLYNAVKNRDVRIFYEEELRQRRELSLPPFIHLCLVKVRGRVESAVENACSGLFEMLSKRNDHKSIRVVSSNPAIQYKLRDKFCRQILIKGASVLSISRFLKKNLRDYSRSGIIVTVDMDPI